MSKKLDAQKVAEFHRKGDYSKTDEIQEAFNIKLSDKYRDGAEELEVMGARGRAYNAQAKDAPLLVRVDRFSGYAEEKEDYPKLLSAQGEINKNNSIAENVKQLSKIFSNKDFYTSMAALRRIHHENDGVEMFRHPYTREKEFDENMRTIYSQFISPDKKTYYGDLAVRMLDGHFGMFDTNADNYTSNMIHSAITFALDPMFKRAVMHDINLNLANYNSKVYNLPSDDNQVMTGVYAGRLFDMHFEEEEIKERYPTDRQGPNDIHFDILTMLALQAERWGIDEKTIKSDSFRENLEDTMVSWAKTVYASRALKMLEAQDKGLLAENKFTLSKDDAEWLQSYVKEIDAKKISMSISTEKDTANGLKEFNGVIQQAIDAGKDNTDSVLNTGYNIHDHGESLEREASLNWLKHDCNYSIEAIIAMKPWQNGRTSSEQPSDALLARSVKHDGLKL